MTEAQMRKALERIEEIASRDIAGTSQQTLALRFMSILKLAKEALAQPAKDTGATDADAILSDQTQRLNDRERNDD